MLVIAGGTFSHYETMPHSHDTDTTSEIATAMVHDHVDLGSGSTTRDDAQLHCGVSILVHNYQFCLTIPDTKPVNWHGATEILTGHMLSHDPPPPRLFS